MTKIEQKAEVALSSLNKSVHEALDKKKRLSWNIKNSCKFQVNNLQPTDLKLVTYNL